MSTPSSNTTVITERPILERERTSWRRESPPMVVSTGKVICFSTSVGAIPPAWVRICTWTFVTSGKASTGSLFMAHRPAPTRRRVAITTSNRCSSENLRILSIIGLFLSEFAFFEFRFQEEPALRRVPLPFFQTRSDFHPASRLGSGRHFPGNEFGVVPCDEQDLLPIQFDDGLLGDGQHRGAAKRNGQLHRGEHPGLELPPRVRHFDPRLHGPCGFIHQIRDVGHPPSEDVVGKGPDLYGCRQALFDLR